MTRLTREKAQEQAARLMANPMLAPQSKEGKKEIVDCLLRHCQGEEHAADVMTRFLDTARDPRNLTAEIAAMARETQTAEEAPAGCFGCEIGEDPNTGEMRWASHVPRDGKGGISCAVRCECDRGLWFTAKDRERAQAQPEKRKPARQQLAHADFARLAAGDVD